VSIIIYQVGGRDSNNEMENVLASVDYGRYLGSVRSLRMTLGKAAPAERLAMTCEFHMPENLFSEIRPACRTVAERAVFVHLNRRRIVSYAEEIASASGLFPELDPRSHYLGHGEETAAFILTLDAINFGSGYFPHLRKRPGMSGYRTVATCLTEYFAANGPPTANELAALTPADCARIFEQDLSNQVAAELMQLFARALNDLGKYLAEKFHGSVMSLIKAAGASVEQLVGLLIHMPFFNDVQMSNGMKVPFYKRAQLTAADLTIAGWNESWGRFNDLERLTIYADNLVPHVLRVDGVLQYEESLASRIDAGELIPRDSIEEIEIRACAVHAVELLAETLRRMELGTNDMKLDYLLWNRGQGARYKSVRRHRTRTVSY